MAPMMTLNAWRITLPCCCWLLLFYCSFLSTAIAFAPLCKFETRRPCTQIIELPTVVTQRRQQHHHQESKNLHANTVLFLSSSSNQDKDTTSTNEQKLQQQSQQDRLTQLGFSPDEIERTKVSKSSSPPPKVSVTEFEVDPVTITALGFGLIAMNFLIFANMGSGGIAGILARIMNTWDN